MFTFEFNSDSPLETDHLAKTFASKLLVGDIIILEGALGSGKTHFTKACLQTLGIQENITSPTFTIANFYTIPEGYIIHSDVYRLKKLEEFLDLGLLDFLPRSLLFIEWGQKFKDCFDDYLVVHFDYSEQNNNNRKISFSSDSTKWSERLHELQGNIG